MLLKTRILIETHNCTISELTIDGVFFSFVLEDGFRETKVPGETRIPAGKYQILQRREGKFYTAYKRRFGHKFVPHLQDVPGFAFILMHIGNGPSDSRGCLLVGRSWGYTGNAHYIGDSTETYKKLYETLEAAFARGEEVWVEIDRTPVVTKNIMQKTDHTTATIL